MQVGRDDSNTDDGIFTPSSDPDCDDKATSHSDTDDESYGDCESESKSNNKHIESDGQRGKKAESQAKNNVVFNRDEVTGLDERVSDQSPNSVFGETGSKDSHQYTARQAKKKAKLRGSEPHLHHGS